MHSINILDILYVFFLIYWNKIDKLWTGRNGWNLYSCKRIASQACRLIENAIITYPEVPLHILVKYYHFTLLRFLSMAYAHTNFRTLLNVTFPVRSSLTTLFELKVAPQPLHYPLYFCFLHDTYDRMTH